MVHAQGTYANVCISPGSPCAGRIADLENQYGKHIARIADLEAQLAGEPDPALGIQCCLVRGRYEFQAQYPAYERRNQQR